MLGTKKKILTLLTTLSVIFIIAGFCTFGAFAATQRIHVVADENGYVASEEVYVIDSNDSVNVTFDLPYVINAGESYVGFGIVKAEELNSSLIDADNSEFGYAVLFDNETSVIGSENAVIDNAQYGKTELLKRDYNYKATFDNGNGTFVLEKKISGSNLYSTVQKVTGLKTLPDGEYVFGFMFSKGAELVMDALSFNYTEVFANVDDTPAYATELNKVDGGAFVELDSATGKKVNYSNKNTISTLDGEEIVVSLETSTFSVDGGKIGFAIGKEKSADGIIGGTGAIFYSFNQSQGVTKYLNGNFENGTFIDDFVEVNSIFTSGRSVKARFNFVTDTFTLLVRLSEGAAFKEVFTDTNANLSTGEVYIGLQMVDKVHIKMPSISVYFPADINSYATEGPELVFDEGDLEYEKTSTSEKISLVQPGDSAPCRFIYTEDPVTVADDESVIVYMENIRWTMESPNYYQKTSFTFANGKSHEGAYGSFYTENTCVSLQYDLNRGTYYLTNNADMPADQKNLVITTAITFYSLFKEAGNSIMAVFSPKLNTYSLYMKSAVEPDYTLWQTFTVPQAAQGCVDSTLYVGFEMYGGMTIEVDEFKVYTAKNEDIAASAEQEMEFKGDGEKTDGGLVLDATADAYASFEPFTVSDDYDYLALEYSIESISYTDAAYTLGYLITDGDTLPAAPEVIDREVEGNPVISGSFIDGDTSDFYAFIASDGLTETMNDKMRNFMFHMGYSLRALFSFKDGTVTMQYKPQNGYSWNNITVYDDLKEYEVGSTVRVALMVEDTTKLALSDLRAYTVKDYQPTDTYVYEGATADDIGDATMCTVTALSDNVAAGKVYIDEEGVDEKTLITSTEITLYAEVYNEYVFDGWYLGNSRVSKDVEFTVTALQSEQYTAKFLPASMVVINNGKDKAASVVNRYFASGLDLGIMPENVQKYNFDGWTIAYKERTATAETVVCQYYLGISALDDSANMLNGKTNLKVWGTLKNELTATDTCSVVTESTGGNRITFGMFSIVDRAGYEDGSLIINIPAFDSEFDADGNPTTERYVEITANYVKKDVQSSLITEEEYSKEYQENLKKIFTAFIITATCTVIAVIALIVIKKRFIKK